MGYFDGRHGDEPCRNGKKSREGEMVLHESTTTRREVYGNATVVPVRAHLIPVQSVAYTSVKLLLLLQLKLVSLGKAL